MARKGIALGLVGGRTSDWLGLRGLRMGFVGITPGAGLGGQLKTGH